MFPLIYELLWKCTSSSLFLSHFFNQNTQKLMYVSNHKLIHIIQGVKLSEHQVSICNVLCLKN